MCVIKSDVEKNQFLQSREKNATFVFSTSKGNLNFNINTQNGISNLDKLKNWFGCYDIGYLRQIHSDIIYNYDGDIHEGDAIITNKKNIAIGVFTADCVPVLLYDKKNEVIAAVHSGWKGTYALIVLKTLKKMKQQYKTNFCDVIAYIGPHNKSCCYQVGDDLKKMFNNHPMYKELQVIENGNLNIQKCIIHQLINNLVKKENIHLLNLCTYCNKEYEFFSYRKNKSSEGRMFSFVFLK